MKAKTLFFTFMLLIIIALLLQQQQRLEALDTMTNQLSGIKSQYANVMEKQEYQSTLLQEIVTNQHKPVPQQKAPEPKIESPSPMSWVPILPFLMEKLRLAF